MSTTETQSAVAGWYPDPQYAGHSRYWDGAQWTNQRQVTAPAQPSQAVPQRIVVSGNLGIQRKKVNHVLHFILCVCTAGLWLPVWIIVAISA